MPVLTHLTAEKSAGAIRWAGIKAVSAGHGTPMGVFCMPLLPDHFASHQWLRELKRRGQRTLVAVDFRLRSDEPVWFGHYCRLHVETTVGGAIEMLMGAGGSLGFEVVVPRKIRIGEILRVRTPRQVIKWRYHPESHRQRPTCACRMCLPRGSIKSRRLRHRLDPTGEDY